MRYDLRWKCLPMDAIQGHDDWYDPYLGSGVYMLVAATTQGRYAGYYVGQSVNIGRRWRQHVKEWFEEPHEGYWIPESATDFLANPAEAFNGERLAQNLKDRREIQAQILEATWFCFAEVDELRPWHSLENVEYVLQEGLKQHESICKDGYIGDTGRGKPGGELVIANHFRPAFLGATLPATIRFPGAVRSVEVGKAEPKSADR